MPIVVAILLIVPLANVPSGRTAGGQVPASGVQTTAEKPWPPAGVFRTGDGVKAPLAVERPNPSYTAAAMRARIEGKVIMEAVVEADGTVGEVRVTRSLDREFGLDEEAVRTLKVWEFEPARRDGVAVPVLVTVEMAFTLRK